MKKIRQSLDLKIYKPSKITTLKTLPLYFRIKQQNLFVILFFSRFGTSLIHFKILYTFVDINTISELLKVVICRFPGKLFLGYKPILVQSPQSPQWQT
jgi:hypothetical protein